MTTTDGREVLDPNLDKNVKPFKSVGAPGFAIYSGFLIEREKDPKLTGLTKYRTYADILANTSIVSAGVRFFLNLVAKARWRVDPADESSAANELAELVDEVMNDMSTPWHRVVRRAAMYRFYGFSIQEWTAKRRDDGVIGFLDVEPRPQQTVERWDTDESGTVVGVIQRSPQTQKDIYLPRQKIVYMVDDTISDSPEGLGLFRHMAKPAHRLERYEILEGWGFERDLRGTPIGRGPLTQLQQMVPDQISEEDAQLLRDPIELWIKNALKGKDTALFLDSATYRSLGEQQQPSQIRQWDVELLQGGATSQPEMAKAIERVNREMARVLGIEQLMLGEGSAGSHALARDKTQSFGLMVDSTLMEIREQFEKDVLNPLWEMNGWDEDLMPTFATEQVQYRDIEQIGSVIRDAASAGVMLDRRDKAVGEIYELVGLSAPEAFEEDLAIPGEPLPGQVEPGGEESTDEVPEGEEGERTDE